MNLTDEQLIAELRKLPELNVSAAVERTGSETSYRGVLTLCARTLPVFASRLNSYFDTDIARYAIEVHGIKGVLKTIGADKLSETAFALEQTAKSNSANFEDFKNEHSDFFAKLTDFAERLLLITDNGADVQKKPGNKAELETLLPKMIAALKTFNIKEARFIYKRMAEQTFSTALDAQIEQLGRCLDFCNYDKALAEINEMNGELYK